MELDKDTIQDIIDLQRLKKLEPDKTAKAYSDVFAKSIKDIVQEYINGWNKVFVDLIGWGIDCKISLSIDVWEEEDEAT